ncbi:lanthionine synthetase LanC family protein [Sphingobacterium ginsenosidimutans]|uniref:Lantibiotic biosynthesis protein dehydration domain-containing protein n=1 Tax=Sphingobacterium ginsenosidimutans TaxID=687845 RepID=A0ABP7ZQZ8_9SPHI
MYKHYIGQIINYSLEKEISSLDDINITNGLSGITLLLIKYYQVYKCDSVLNSLVILSERIDSTYAKFDISVDFYTGHLGIAYMFALLSTITDDTCNEKRVETILSKLDFDQPLSSSDVLVGHSGVLLGLIKLNEIYSHGIELNEILVKIFRNAKFDNISNGVIFDRRPNQLKEYCGFAHGVSGVAYVLAVYSKNSCNGDLYKFIRRCLKYENHYLTTYELWPDFRAFPIVDLEGAISRYFDTGKDGISSHVSWCNGFSGIGINRIFLYKLFGDKELLEDIELVRNNISKYIYKQTDLSVCCGLGSMMLFLLVDFLILDNSRSKIILEEIFLSKFLQKKVDSCTDYSMFYGLSGILYIYLYFLEGVSDNNFLFYDHHNHRYENKTILYEDLMIKLKYPDLYARMVSQQMIDSKISFREFFHTIQHNESFNFGLYLGKKKHFHLRKSVYYNSEIYAEEILCKHFAECIEKEGLSKIIVKIELKINERMFVDKGVQSIHLEVVNIYSSNKFAISNQLFSIIKLFNSDLTITDFIKKTELNDKLLIASFVKNQILIPVKSEANRLTMNKVFGGVDDLLNVIESH